MVASVKTEATFVSNTCKETMYQSSFPGRHIRGMQWQASRKSNCNSWGFPHLKMKILQTFQSYNIIITTSVEKEAIMLNMVEVITGKLKHEPNLNFCSTSKIEPIALCKMDRRIGPICLPVLHKVFVNEHHLGCVNSVTKN